MTAMPPWSFSSLTSFETCPKRYYHLKCVKDVTEVPNEATTWGTTVHKHLEDRVALGTPLPQAIAGYESFVAKIAAHPGEKLVEQQMAITADFKPTGWTSETAWCRGIVDVGLLTGKRALLLDWKTGKRKPDSSQLQLFAGLAFVHFPNVEVVATAFVWLKEGKTDKASFKRQDAPVIWQEFVPRVRRMERAYEENKFPPKPSGLCGKWCPVPKRLCSFSGKT